MSQFQTIAFDYKSNFDTSSVKQQATIDYSKHKITQESNIIENPATSLSHFQVMTFI